MSTLVFRANAHHRSKGLGNASRFEFPKVFNVLSLLLLLLLLIPAPSIRAQSSDDGFNP